MMKRSERGAAKVSVVWAVGFMMAFLASIVAFFLISGTVTQERERADLAVSKIKELEAKVTTEITARQNLSKVIGYYDEATSNNTDQEVLQSGLKSLRETFTDLDPTIKTFQKAMPVIVTTYNSKVSRIKDLENQNGELRTQNETLAKSVRELGETSNKDLQALRSQLTDAELAKSDMQQDYEKRLAEVTDNFKQRDAEVNKLKGQLDDLQRKTAQEKEALRTRMAEQEKKLNPFVKEPESADGKVLGVSKDLNLGWINLGSKNRLAVGTRFRIVSGAHGSNQVKGWAEVRQVDADMSEVSFTDQRDPFDPPVPGDVVFNPLFDPTGERHAVLAGDFRGTFSEKELKLLLANMAITVQKGLDQSTDFLIVGSEMFTDENKQPLETPIQPSDLPVYKDAQAQGVQIIQLKDLRQYFRF